MTTSDPHRVLVEHLEGIFFLYEDRDDLRYTFVGGSGLDEVGLTAAELEGSVVAADRPPEIRERVHERYRAALDGEDVEFEIEAEARHFRFRLRPVVDDAGAVVAGAGVAQDITDQVVYREELERANDRLERITQLAFHDIRNPLSIAQARLELLREECDSEHVEPVSSALDRIEALTDREATTIGELDEGSLDAVALDAVVEAAWRNVATPSATLDAGVAGSVLADPDDLRRLLENLFRNAVEHGSTGSRTTAGDAVGNGGDAVTVTVGTLPDGFYVADDGPGIPAERRDEVFERGTSDAGGSGLGLFIVARVVEAHGWEVSVGESDAGGARFEFTGVEPAG